MSETLAGRYTLGPLLGAGGMGRVHAAHDLALDRPVAVKLLGERVDATGGARLLAEARTAARFQHPNAVAVFDVGEHDGQPFVVMELVEGESLADRLRRRGRLPPDEVVGILSAVLTALDAAHAAGLVHRDVKPANVLLPADGPAKLADFGIAKQVWEPASGLTSAGIILGTPTYLAPEQAAGKPPTFAVDLYAVGVVAYEALTGAPPFSGTTPLATALAHQRDPVPPLAEAAPEVPGGLAAAVERALAKEPGERFRSAAEMRAALRAPASRSAPPGAGARGPGRPEGAGAGAGRAWKVAAAACVVAVGALLLLSERWGQDPPDGPELAEDADGTDEADAEPGGSGGDEPAGASAEGDGGAAGPEPGSGPASLDELVALLAQDPGEVGERGDDLLDDLLEVLRESDEDDQREDARELIRDIAKWQAEGELAEPVAVRAIELLEPVGRPPDGELAPLSAAFAALAARSADGGPKHEDVLSKLDEVLSSENENQRRNRAEQLLREIDKWEQDGELHAEVAAQARDALTRFLDDRTSSLNPPVRRLLDASHHH